MKGLIIPSVQKGMRHVYHQYSVMITEEFGMTRDALMQRLREKGIMTSVFYPKPLHLHPHFASMGYKPGDFPVSEKVSGQILSLPVHPLVEPEDIQRIIKIIGECAR